MAKRAFCDSNPTGTPCQCTSNPPSTSPPPGYPTPPPTTPSASINGACVFVNGVPTCCASGCFGCSGCTTTADCFGPCSAGSTAFCGNYGTYTDCSCVAGCPAAGCGSIDCSSYAGSHGACCTVDNTQYLFLCS
ncbi:unnamed protein product [Rotaria sp. Silwood1]|nr:unnamed protein product [Rotaria sp. Silwood1]